MTTIAYRNGVMAADTMMVRGDEKCMGAVKIAKIRDMLVGYAGSAFDIAVLFDWLHEANVYTPGGGYSASPPVSEDGIAIIVHAGVIYNVRTFDMVAVRIDRDFEAIGSGSEYALGAMSVGADAIHAVESAIRFDCLSGGAILTVEEDK